MIIYKKYNQQELDLQYNNRFHVPDFENYLQGWETLSRQAEKKHRVIKNIPYGDASRECLDIFPSAKPASKTLIFIHGGYWQRFDKTSFHFIAGAFARYNITTVLINYPLVPVVSMDRLVKSCRKAVDWAYDNITHMNGDSNQIYIAGHSAGAHLAAMLMTREETHGKESLIKGVCAISGLFNLIPIQLSNINEGLQMDKDAAISNSPALKVPSILCPLLIAVGDAETNEFLDQSRELIKTWKNKIRSVELIEIPDLNHFSILDSIADPNSLLHKSITRLMKI